MSDKQSVRLQRTANIEHNQKMWQSLRDRIMETYAKQPVVAPVPNRISEEIEAAIDSMDRETLTDILDDALGFSCYDEQDDEALRVELTNHFLAGTIDYDTIMEHGITEDEAPAPGM